jgi:hypothetical protein
MQKGLAAIEGLCTTDLAQLLLGVTCLAEDRMLLS